jgi:hypothetical protein
MKRRIASHAAALVVGIALAAAVANMPADSPSNSSGESPAARETRSSRPGRETSKIGTLRSEDYRRAWAAVASKELSLLDRRSLQVGLLERWAEVDLEGALQAAMAEAWDNDYNPGFSVLGTAGHPLIGAFSEAFAERPLDAWELINSGKFGVGAHILREQWVTSVAAKDGVLLISMLAEVPPSMREGALNRAMEEAKTRPEVLQAILAKLLALPPGEESDSWLKVAASNLPDGGDPVALRENWLNAQDGSPRTLALMSWGANLRRADEATLLKEWENIPEARRGEAAKAMLSPMNYESKALTTAIDLAMQAGEWDFLAANAPEQLRWHAHHTDPVKLAEWAMELPERPETVELFHRAVGRYIGDDLPRAKGWLEQMEPGDWRRERGLAEYSQQALRRHQDPEASRWALDRITDPALKQAAEGWRQDWERETGKVRFGGP